MIFCFSACGNTELVASRLATLLGERIERIDINTPHTFDIRYHKRVIWATPVYSWGLPKVVISFIRSVQLTGGEDTEHYLVATCGDDAGLTDKMWRRAIRKRGWAPRGAHTVIMPNTYVSLPGFDVDSPGLATRKLHEAVGRVSQVARAIRCRSNVDSITRGKCEWIKTRIIYPLFMACLTTPKPFRAGSSCTGCSLCSRVCPMGNISVVNGIPQWGNRCVMCLGCYHHCPHKSIAYGKATKGKGQYTAPKFFPD